MKHKDSRCLREPSTGSRSQQLGMNLIEVMVSVLIMGIGLLGIAALQTTALRNSQSALERSQAVIQTYAIVDAMRANRDQALMGAYNTGGYQCGGVSGADLAASDLDAWVTSLKATMGVSTDGTTCGEVDCDAGLCTIGVQWDDGRASDNGGAGDTARIVETRVLL